MKHLIAPLLALVLLSSGTTRAQDTRLKVATVDMQELFQQYHRTKSTTASMEADVGRVKKDQEERMAHLQTIAKAVQDFDKQINDPSVAEAKRREIMGARQLKAQELQGLQTELEEFLKRKDRAVKEQIMIQMKSILDEIRVKVQKHAEDEGFDYVLDKSGTSTSQVPILLYTKDATDITDVLMKTLNDGAPAPEEKKEEGK